MVIVNDKGALLIVFAANYYGQHPRQQADAAVQQLTKHLFGSCDQPHTLESYMDLHGLLPAGGFEKASQQAKEASEKDLAAAEEHPMLYEGFGWGGVPDVLLSALEDKTTDVKLAGSADVRKAVPIQVSCRPKSVTSGGRAGNLSHGSVPLYFGPGPSSCHLQVACEITFAEEMGTTKAHWGEPVNQWNRNDSVAFHLKVPGLEKPAIEAWSHGYLKQTASTIVTELEKLGNSITSGDTSLLLASSIQAASALASLL